MSIVSFYKNKKGKDIFKEEAKLKRMNDKYINTEIDGKSYFIEKTYDLRNLIAYKLCNYLNIPCASYKLVIKKGVTYLISPNPDYYTEGFKIFGEDINKTYKDWSIKASNNIKDDILNMYFFDLFMGNTRRNITTISVDTTKDRLILIDNRGILKYSEYSTKTFENKLASASVEFKERFDYFFKRLNPYIFIQILNQIEKDNGIKIIGKEKYISSFVSNYYRLQELYKTYAKGKNK